MNSVRVEKCPLFSEALKDEIRSIPTPLSLTEEPENPSHQLLLKEIDNFFRVSAMRFGSIYGFIQEQNGATVQNLFPIKTDEKRQISSSSETILEMHTETAFHPWRPEVVLLLCVKDDPNAGTNVSVLSDIIKALDDETIEALHHPEFTTHIDESFQSSNQPDKELKTPILFDQGTKITYDRALMKPTTKRSAQALNLLSEAIEKTKTTIYLKMGEIMILDNRTAIHGRTPFKARYDGTDRWLKRIMVSTKLPEWDEMEIRDGRFRVVTTLF